MPHLAISGGTPVRKDPFSAWPVVTGADEEAMVAVTRSAKWGRYLGDRVKTFEGAFAKMMDVPYCVALTNGTNALEACLYGMDTGAGDEVIVPSFTFYATVSAVLVTGALPIMVDIDPLTLCMDPGAAAKAVTENTRALIPVHLGGGSADMKRLTALCADRNLLMLEDACQAHLAEWEGKKVGTIGDCGCFSFQASKNLSGGEGGAIVTNSEDLYNKVYSFHTCGRPAGGFQYKHIGLGSNYRMSEFHGAILLSQIERLEEQSRHRTANAEYLSERLQQIDGITPPGKYPGTTRHVYYVYVLKYDGSQFGGMSRMRFIEALQAEGIPAMSGYVPLHREPFFDAVLASRSFKRIYGDRHLRKWQEQCANQCPLTDKACEEEAVWLPQTPLMGSRDDVDDVVRAFEKIYEYKEEITP